MRSSFHILVKRVATASGGRFWWGTLRVMGFLAVVNLGVVGARLPSALAAAESTAKKAGAELLAELGPAIIGGTQGVLVNGQRLFIAAKSTRVPAKDVLDTFERHCKDGAAEWRGEVESLTRNAKLMPAALRDVSRATTFRMEPDGASPGQVGCIVPNGSMGGVAGLAQRMTDFAATGDLAKFGDGRLAVVQQNPKTGVTRVVAVWTEGPFSLLTMFPETGDAPGRDSPYAPRPHDARRIFSAEMEGRPYAMRVYDSARPRAEVLSTYSTEMAALGWASQPMPSLPEFDPAGNARTFEKDGTAVIVAARDDVGERTTVTVLEMASPGFVRTAENDSP